MGPPLAVHLAVHLADQFEESLLNHWERAVRKKDLGASGAWHHRQPCAMGASATANQQRLLRQHLVAVELAQPHCLPLWLLALHDGGML